MDQPPYTPLPPAWADRLLRLVCPAEFQEELLGDLYEQFQEQVIQLGEPTARRLYVWKAIRFCRPYFFRRRLSYQTAHTPIYHVPSSLNFSMVRNYLKIAFRNLIKNKLFSAINVFGLALGMSCSLIIGLWVNDELSFNRFFKNLDQLYMIRLTGGATAWEQTPSPLTEALKAEIPAVDKAVKLTWKNNFLIKVGTKAGKEEGYYASDDLFDVFQLPALQGNPAVAIKNPNNIVITRSVAQKYFGTTDVVGQVLQLNNTKQYVVGAVIEDVPLHSSIQFNWVVNFKVQQESWMHWGNNSFIVYVKLKPHATQAQAEAAMKPLLARHTDDKYTYPILQPLKDVYLYGEYVNGKPAGGRIDYIKVYVLVALFILLIACVNFMNLATARSATRAKEVGVRKVVGAPRSALVGQFMGEAFLVSILAAGIALLLAWLIIPVINEAFQKQLRINFAEPVLWVSFAALVGLTTLVAGSYPAFFLSAMKPVRVLKAGTAGIIESAKSKVGVFRKTLVVFQFSLSILLIIGMLVVGRQMNYIQTKHLGLDRENILYVPVEGNLSLKMEAFRQELLRSKGISAVTTTGELPIHIGSTASGQLIWPGKDPKYNETIWNMMVGHDFIKTMNVKLLAGRDFQKTTDSSNYIINESAAKMMGLQDPVGQPVTYKFGKGQIIGLMKDFHMSSLHDPIQPLIFMFKPEWTNFLLIKTRSGQMAEAIRYIEQTTHRFNLNYPFDYHFLDKEYGKLYRSEQLVNTLVNYFGLLAVVISCLGLFGLAAFMAERRSKEIGVRKVLGASVTSVVTLLSTDFLKLVLIAILIASPLAWYAMDQWLQNFAYKVAIEWWMFVLAGLLAVGIALLTVSFQSLKAALVNPVRSLRSE